MNNLKPYIIFAIIGFTILIGLLIYGIRDSRVSEPPPESQTELKLGTLFIEGGSAVKGVVIPSFFRPQTLASLVYDVVDCESKWNHYDKDGNILVGDKDKKYQAFGIGQYQIRTFLYLSGLAGKELDWKSEADQLWLLEWAIKSGKGCLWTCYQWITDECN